MAPVASLLSLALVLFGLGCGFGPQDDFSGRRAGDGIAPWTDLGPVQMCLGNQLIGPPESPPGGFCKDINTGQEPCLGDSQCGSRESCVCGRCTLQYCTAASDCSIGRVCSFGERRCDIPCARNSDCRADREECMNAVCRGRCFEDTDCQNGEVCNSQNVCIGVSCADDSRCLASERCELQQLPRVAVEPSVLARARPGEPVFVMWLELSDVIEQSRRAIYRARSDDGLHYVIDPAEPVIDDRGAAHAPAVVRVGDEIVIFYEQGDGAQIRVARSADGISFGEPTTALTGTPGGAAAVRAPSAVVLPDGRVALYYQVGDGAAISLAMGASLDALPFAQGTPVLTPRDVEDPPQSPPGNTTGPGEQFWIDIETVRSPHALLTPSPRGAPSLRLWFSAFGHESNDTFQFGDTIPVPPNYSIGYAAAGIETPDVLTLWPYNPVFDRVRAFLEHRSELAPAVVQLADEDGAPLDAFVLYVVDAEVESATMPAQLNRLGALGNGGYPAIVGSTE